MMLDLIDMIEALLDLSGACLKIGRASGGHWEARITGSQPMTGEPVNIFITEQHFNILIVGLVGMLRNTLPAAEELREILARQPQKGEHDGS